MYEFKFQVGERVCGPLLFSGTWVEGMVIEQDAGISRDAIVVQLDNGDKAIILEDHAKRVKNEH